MAMTSEHKHFAVLKYAIPLCPLAGSCFQHVVSRVVPPFNTRSTHEISKRCIVLGV